jgi:sterol desaturase/sphingolipid hydroxylase (fatty acid hydroxylase superfamily)
MPASVDRVMRLIFVTPDMHRIHHSQNAGESRANFANVFTWWDRLFGTYIDQPASGHDAIRFGLKEFAERKHLTLRWMLVQPLLGGDRTPRDRDDYPMVKAALRMVRQVGQITTRP